MSRRSEYYLSLSADVKCRYDKKIELIEDIDPYTLSDSEVSKDLSAIPKVHIVDLMNYLVLTHSFYTGQQLKAFKSLQAYKLYEAGHVLEVVYKKININLFVALGKVRHSQKTREKPNRAWIILMEDGSICTAHCTCMAGLGETCSHVAAILFLIERFSEGRNATEETSCTDILARWPVPSTSQGVQMLRIKDMDWARKGNVTPHSNSKVNPMTDEELETMVKELQEIDIIPAVARVLEPFASQMVPPEKLLPKGLPEIFFNKVHCIKTYGELTEFPIEIILKNEDFVEIESATKDQCKSDLWYQFRAGRITASKCRTVCKAQINKPPLSLIKGICYPLKMAFYSKQTNYGLKNEKNALEEYFNEIKDLHEDLSIQNTGFIISRDHPELGASPDSIIKCKCCGSGCVEVKCPFLLKNMDIKQYASRKNTCLVPNNGSFSLNRDHLYFYQVQFQMYITKTLYCDFVIWSKDIIHIERIPYNQQFCEELIRSCLEFHKFVIKPELLARFFTNKLDNVATWCICRKRDDGKPMLRCDNANCEVEWYHFNCVGVLDTPAYWLCPKCQINEL